MAGHESGASTLPTSQPRVRGDIGFRADEAAAETRKRMTEPRGNYTYRDAMTGRPISPDLAAVVSQLFDEVEAVQAQGEMAYKDAITGQLLNSKLVEQARRKEFDYFETKEVWYKRPRLEAFKMIGKRQITAKWVDINKGDDANPMYRSRLVARELRLLGQDSIFAPTPLLEALRTVLGMAATDIKGAHKHDRRADSEMRTQVSVIDISRAYFNAVKDPEVDPTYVELPHEDPGRA